MLYIYKTFDWVINKNQSVSLQPKQEGLYNVVQVRDFYW